MLSPPAALQLSAARALEPDALRAGCSLKLWLARLVNLTPSGVTGQVGLLAVDWLVSGQQLIVSHAKKMCSFNQY